MKLSRAEVLHIAELAKLGVTEDEVERFADKLSEILDYADMLGQLDTDAIPPTARVTEMQNVTRDDVVQPSLTPDQALGNAPRRQDNCFAVKAILEP